MPRPLRSAAALVLCAGALALLGCTKGGAPAAGEASKGGDPAPQDAAAERDASATATAPTSAPKPDAEAEIEADAEAPASDPQPPPAATLERSAAALAIKATVDRDPGFRLEPLTKMHALAAAPQAPSFGAPLRDPGAAYDDDLLTAATCAPQAEEPCAIGLALADDAEVTMLRLFLAAGPDYRDYTGAPRPKKIAIHTDAGKVELDYPDGAAHRFVIFAAPVRTKGLSVEVLEVYKGRGAGDLHFAEVEVYGTRGAARPPLELDPRHAFVYFETQPWKDKGGGAHTVKMTWLETFGYGGIGVPGPRRRWLRGMAAFGRAEDRFVLVEKGLSSTCDAPEVGYLLIDKTTRVIYPLGPMAGGAAAIHRHSGGLGFFMVPAGIAGDAGPSEALKGARSIVFDPATQSFDRRRGGARASLADQLRDGGFDEAAPRPGGVDLDAYVGDPKSHCEALDAATLADAVATSEVLSAEHPGAWWSCGIGDGHRVILGRDAACGEAVSVMIKTPEGELRRRAEFPAGAGPRRVAVERDPAFPGVLVEVGKESGAASDLVPVNIDHIDEPILRDASLGVRPPDACGPCLLTYAGAAAVADDPGADDGDDDDLAQPPADAP
ncbi:MAG: hypothetical protein R3A79_13940 [Nannocystaceae bacterium]